MNFNDDQISIILKTFTIWLSMNDEIIEELIIYWKSIMPQKVIQNNEELLLRDLAIITLRLLALLGTEAICERCFSQLKLIHSHLRTKLKTDILDSILRIKTNLIGSKEIEDIQLY